MRLIPVLIGVWTSFVFGSPGHGDLLTEIQRLGYIQVGTTGDYKPFTYHDGNNFSGYDIAVAKHFARELGVELRFVKTTWKGLLNDIEAGKFHIAMGGITRTTARQLTAEQTQGYITFGKCFLVAKGHAHRFDTLEKVNRPDVTVGVNIGGTNEEFALEFLTQAKLIRFENNLDVPEAVAEGKVDVMVTESPEALFYQANDQRLEAVRAEDPFTRNQFCYLIPKGQQQLLNTVNFLMDQMKLKGIDIELMEKNSLQNRAMQADD